MNNEEFKTSLKTDIPQTNSTLQNPESNEALHNIKEALRILDQVTDPQNPATFDKDAIEGLYKYLYEAQASLENTTPSIQSDKESNTNNLEGGLDISEFC